MGTVGLGLGAHDFLIHVGMSSYTASWMRTLKVTGSVQRGTDIATSTHGVARPTTSHVVMGVVMVCGLHGMAMGGGATTGRTVGANSHVPRPVVGSTSRSDVMMKDGSVGAPCRRRAGFTCVMVHLCLLRTTSGSHHSQLLSGHRRDSFWIQCCTLVSHWARKGYRHTASFLGHSKIR
jgi:hypothetical protein